MKRTVITAVILCMLISLTGCYSLDIEGRKNSRAFYTDETHSTARLGENEYTRFDGSCSQDIIFNYGGYITEEDVPVLLAQTYGDFYTEAGDCAVLKVTDDYFNYTYYVRNDYMDEFKKIVSGQGLEHYCFFRSVESATVPVLVNQAEAAAIEATVSGMPVQNVSITELDQITKLYSCDSAMICARFAYRVMQSESGDLYLISEYYTYPVSKQYESIFLGMAEE